MVINIRLIKAVPMGDEYDSMGRAWYGYDPLASPAQLWRHNRGRWSLDAARIEREQYATLVYQGRVVLVAELHEPRFEFVEDSRRGVWKKALIGVPLEAGHHVHDALIDTEIPWVRNPVSYSPDPR